MKGALSRYFLSLQKAKTFLASIEFKKIIVQFCYFRLYLGVESVSFRLFRAMDGKDGNGLKVENFGPNFSSFNEMPAKPTKKLLWIVLPCEICSS